GGFLLLSAEKILDQDHIGDGAAGDAEQGVFLPLVQRGGKGDGQQLRQAVPAGKDCVLQAVDHQQPDHRVGQHRAQVGDGGGGRFALRKDEEGQKTGQHGGGDHRQDGQDALGDGHGHGASTSSRAKVLWVSRKLRMIRAMAGTMKLLLPNTSRQAREQPTPTRAGRWSLASSHWLRNMTTNRAVMTNSMPVVSKWMTYPSRAPAVAPATQ